VLPQHDDAHLVLDVRNAQRTGEVPLLTRPFPQRLAWAAPRNLVQRI
jgi:hypothetical protein